MSADRLSFGDQSAILAAAVDSIAADFPVPVSLVGHSIGGMLAIVTAAATTSPVTGIEVSGLGELWQPGPREMWGSMIGDPAVIELPPEAHSGVMLGPAETQKPGAPDLNAALLRPMPMPELSDVVEWSDSVPSAAAAITVSIKLTLAEFDNIWQADAAAQSALARHFTASPRVEIGQFVGARHSIEFHSNAGDYVASQLDFIDSLRRRLTSPTIDSRRGAGSRSSCARALA